LEYGKACGYGKFDHVNVDNYIGEWYNDKANGWGFFTKGSSQDPKSDRITLEGYF
jgi:hypothetical protein